MEQYNNYFLSAVKLCTFQWLQFTFCSRIYVKQFSMTEFKLTHALYTMEETSLLHVLKSNVILYRRA